MLPLLQLEEAIEQPKSHLFGVVFWVWTSYETSHRRWRRKQTFSFDCGTLFSDDSKNSLWYLFCIAKEITWNLKQNLLWKHTRNLSGNNSPGILGGLASHKTVCLKQRKNIFQTYKKPMVYPCISQITKTLILKDSSYNFDSVFVSFEMI